MRTAVTIGKTHKGEWKIVSSPEVPAGEQLQSIRQIRGLLANQEFSEIQYMESDGGRIALKFLTPSEAKSKTASRESELERLKSESQKPAIKPSKTAKA